MTARTATAALLGLALAFPAFAQSGPLTDRDVIGDWNLVITPAERQGSRITVDLDDDDLPLTVRSQAGGRLTCTIDGDPADCRLRNGQLVVTTALGSGSRMIFEIAQRTRAGFAGAARLSIRLLPVGGHIGSVAMTRR